MSTLEFPKHTTPVIKLNQPDDTYKYQPLQKPSGSYPYHLSIDTNSTVNSNKMVFQIVGDTGGRLNPDFQRFHKNYPDGKTLPFIVVGAGGFDELHGLARTNQDAYSPNHPLLEHVKLMDYCDNQHGFLKVTLGRYTEGIDLIGAYYVIPHQIELKEHATLADRFSYRFEMTV